MPYSIEDFDPPSVENYTGSNCGDALACYLNSGPLKESGYSLPRGGVGPGDLASVGRARGSQVYGKKDISPENLTPGTVIHMTRQPNDKNYDVGKTHIGIVDTDDNGNKVFKSFTSGKGWRTQPINQKFISQLPNNIIASNLVNPELSSKTEEYYQALKNPGERQTPQQFPPYQIASAGKEIPGPTINIDDFDPPTVMGKNSSMDINQFDPPANHQVSIPPPTDATSETLAQAVNQPSFANTGLLDAIGKGGDATSDTLSQQLNQPLYEKPDLIVPGSPTKQKSIEAAKLAGVPVEPGVVEPTWGDPINIVSGLGAIGLGQGLTTGSVKEGLKSVASAIPGFLGAEAGGGFAETGLEKSPAYIRVPGELAVSLLAGIATDKLRRMGSPTTLRQTVLGGKPVSPTGENLDAEIKQLLNQGITYQNAVEQVAQKYNITLKELNQAANAALGVEGAVVSSAKAGKEVVSEEQADKAASVIGKWQNEGKKTLQSVGPDTSEFLNAAKGNKYLRSLQASVAPETLETSIGEWQGKPIYAPLARRTQSAIVEQSGRTMQQQMQFENAINRAGKEANIRSLAKDPVARMNFYDAVESNSVGNLSPEMQKFANVWRSYSDKVWKDIDTITNGRISYIENYWPHMWKDPDKARAYLAGFNPTSGAPLPYIPSKRFFKQRKFDLYSDAVKWGLEEKFPNPLDAVKANLWEKNRFLTFQRVVNDLKSQGLAQHFIDGKQPHGWVKVDSPALQNKFGSVYMPQDAARVINNHLQPGLWGNPWYSTYRNGADAIKATQVALSGYHGTLVTLLDMSMGFGSDMRLALAKGLRGDITGMATGFAKAGKNLFVPTQIADYLMTGKKIRKAYLEPGAAGVTKDMEEIANRFAAAGGRVNRDSIMSIGDSFADAMVERQGLGSVSRAYQTFVRGFSHWIMGEVVPRAQMHTFQKLANNEMEMFQLKNGRGPTSQEMVKIDQGVTQHIQNLMGQLPSDNLAMSRQMIQMLYPVVNFPGWNIGSTRWIAGLARGGIKAAYREKLDQQAIHSIEALAGMGAVYGLYGGITHYILTGEMPKSIKNLRYPGKKGEEVQLAGYLRDLYGWRYHPVNTIKSKLGTPFRITADLLDNMDYAGNRIYDPLGEEKGEQIGNYIGKSIMPFGVQSAMRSEDVPTAVSSIVGATLAPRWALDTPAETAMREARRATYAKNPQEMEKADLKYKLRREYDLGKVDQFKEDLTKGVEEGTLTHREARDLRKQMKLPKNSRQFKSMTDIDDMVRVYRLGDPEEKSLFGPILKKRINNMRLRDRDKYKKYRYIKEEIQ